METSVSPKAISWNDSSALEVLMDSSVHSEQGLLKPRAPVSGELGGLNTRPVLPAPHGSVGDQIPRL